MIKKLKVVRRIAAAMMAATLVVGGVPMTSSGNINSAMNVYAATETTDSAYVMQEKDFTYWLLPDNASARLVRYNGPDDAIMNIPTTIDGHKVKAIAANIFRDKSKLIGELIIPDEVETIGQYAFEGCSGLTGELTSIGKQAFYECTGFDSSVTLLKSVEYVGAQAFAYCDNIKDLYVMNPVCVFPEANNLFRDNKQPFKACGSHTIHGYEGSTAETYYNRCVENENSENETFTSMGIGPAIERTVMKVSDFSYEYNSDNETIKLTAYNGPSVAELRIPSDIDGHEVTVLGDGLFNNMNTILGNITIPDTIVEIGNYVFRQCEELEGSIIIPDGVKTIGSSAFYNCSKLTGILRLPASLTTLEAGAFTNCSGLTGDLVIPNGITVINSSTFRGCSNLSGDLIIPDSVTYIDALAFYGCIGFTGAVIIPQSVICVGQGAFERCNNITDLYIMNSLCTLPSYGRLFNYAEGNESHVLHGYAGSTVEDYCKNVESIGNSEHSFFKLISDADLENVEKERLVKAFVKRMYTIVLGRYAETEGMNAWKNALLNKQVTGAAMASAFFGGDEFVAKNLSDTEYMNVVYKAIMGREADTEGMNVWLGYLAGHSREEMFDVFAGSNEFKAIVAGYGL